MLEGAANFRDLGGWGTEDGRKLILGALFRSNALARLSEGDLIMLNGLGIKVVHDLRARLEREGAPTAWSCEGLVTKTYRPPHKRRLVDMALEYSADVPGIRRLMHDFYCDLPFVFAPVIADVFTSILEEGTPCVVHCSAGKDRTGIVCAVLLAALGVPRSSIIEDYIRSGPLLHARPTTDQTFAPRVDEEAVRRRLPPEAIAVMTAADPAYIEAALDAIDRRYPHISDYFMEELRLDAGHLKRLRDILLV
ncbi:tyrosine-protein phosphatase [Sphingomonas sp. Root710]|uniref:tyrosine-protein phosphatase n=1 Tax=Sphingomonas sp. Root710 TaxID=1736594 RepID=UPI0009EC1232|nr:tyrosine-protein phosphatase [Sphingomonas sp. Root710]